MILIRNNGMDTGGPPEKRVPLFLYDLNGAHEAESSLKRAEHGCTKQVYFLKRLQYDR